MEMPEETSKLHEHTSFAKTGPVHGMKKCVIGRKLTPGDIIEEGDWYESSSGQWLPATGVGATVQEGVRSVFVRPD